MPLHFRLPMITAFVLQFFAFLMTKFERLALIEEVNADILEVKAAEQNIVPPPRKKPKLKASKKKKKKKKVAYSVSAVRVF